MPKRAFIQMFGESDGEVQSSRPECVLSMFFHTEASRCTAMLLFTTLLRLIKPVMMVAV